MSTICIVVLSSCEKELTHLGKEILPSSDELIGEYDSLVNIKTYTINGRALNAYRLPYTFIGSFTDPYFGFSKASILTEFVPYTTDSSIHSGHIWDSLVLILYIQSYFGDTLQNHEISVYEITDTLFMDNVNYDPDLNNSDKYTSITNSNIDPNGYIGSSILGSGVFSAQNSLAIINITDTNFIHRLFTFDSLHSPPLFIQSFKGLYLTTNDIHNKGSIITLNLNNAATRLKLTFHTDDTNKTPDSLLFDFYYRRRFNIFQHQYAGFPINNYMGDSTRHDSIFFVQAMAGVNSMIELTDLDAWKEKFNNDSIIINKAELILEPANISIPYSYTPSGYYPPHLMLYRMDKSDPLNLENLPDDLVFYVSNYQRFYYIDGSYNASKNHYRFNLTYYVQRYLKGEINYKEFILLAGDNYQNAASTGRVMLRSGYNTSNPPTLRIYYTRF